MSFSHVCFFVKNAKYDGESKGRIELDPAEVLSILQKDFDEEDVSYFLDNSSLASKFKEEKQLQHCLGEVLRTFEISLRR